MIQKYDWFTLKDSKRWWYKILHPIESRNRRKWLKECEILLKQEMEKMNFNKKIAEYLKEIVTTGKRNI